MLPFQNGGTLINLIKQRHVFTEFDVKLMAAQLLLAVDFMERKKIIHRDLKPANILINNGD